MPAETIDADLEHDCPRCGRPVRQRFYGPCGACREQLAASVGRDTGGGAEGVESSRFEPSMHVVPNHVATKD